MQNKKPSMGGVWVFSGTTQCNIRILPYFFPEETLYQNLVRMISSQENWLEPGQLCLEDLIKQVSVIFHHLVLTFRSME